MARAANRGIPKWRAGLALAFGLALGGCAMNGTSGDVSRAGGGLDLSGEPRRGVERDVEAPDIFSLEEAGLWDGRPSLGGVWVAHPDVRDPERVIIRNAQNGEAVIGALFRRERENPGPRFQISSEAANALDILPGQPTTLRVTALRLQTIEAEPRPEHAEATSAEPSAGDDAALADGGQSPGAEGEEPRRGLFAGLFQRRQSEPAAGQAEAIAETTLAAPDGAAAPATASASQPDDPLLTASATSAPAPSAATGSEARESRGLLGGLFGRRAQQPEPAPAAAPGVVADSFAAQTAPQPAPQPASQPAGQPVSAAVAASAPAIDRPFVQIGIFSIEANAQNARQQMQAAGLSAEIRRGRANEREFWRVVVGPAPSTEARGAILQQVRGLGFADAYAVVR